MKSNLKAGHRREIKSKSEREEPNMSPPEYPYDEFACDSWVDLRIYKK